MIVLKWSTLAIAYIFVGTVISVALVGFANAGYDVNSHQVYRCNERYIESGGKQDKICKEREQQMIELYKTQKRFNDERDSRDKKAAK